MRHLIATAILFALCSASAFADSEPLEGSIKQDEVAPEKLDMEMPKPVLDMPTPVLPARATTNDAKLQGENGQFGDYSPGKPLKATIKKDHLHGNADENDPNLTGMDGAMDENGRLQGRADKDGASGLASADPDTDDQELMVEWDKWRNRFLWTVQSSLTANMNDPDNLRAVWDPARQVMVAMPRFPLGITTWFSCTITKKRKIENLKLEHTSGYPEYDQAVLDAVRSLEGTSILKFPGRSRRLTVKQMSGIKTSTTGERQFFKFGDVERYRVQP